MSDTLPILGITMGDPSGIGPEIAAKVMERAVEITGAGLSVNAISNVGQAQFKQGTMDVIDFKNVDINSLVYGKVSAMAGNAAFESIKMVIELAMDRKIDTTITRPINKEALNLAGLNPHGGESGMFGMEEINEIIPAIEDLKQNWQRVILFVIAVLIITPAEVYMAPAAAPVTPQACWVYTEKAAI